MHGKAIKEAEAEGVNVKKLQTGYNFLSSERHILALRAAGLAAGEIWRKREFAVVCGVKS